MQDTPVVQQPNSHTHDGINSPQLSYNDLKNKPAGLKLVKYISSSGTSINFSNLNLTKDGAYRLIVNAGNAVALYSDSINLRFNNDSSAIYNETNIGYPSPTSTSVTGQSHATITYNGQPWTFAEILIQPSNIGTLVQTHSTQINGITLSTAVPYIELISSIYLGTTVTSIQLYTAAANTFQWTAWLYKLPTS